jgi:CubicO group peptidase (beta-lactamase class C family)
LFAIGSCTKFFTSTGLSILADEKQIDFNAPVTTYYPELKLKDTVLQKEITVKDILSHHTGLESGDYIFYGANYSRQEILDKLVQLDKVAGFRNAFVYNSMMYTLAGTIIEKQSNLLYEKFITTRLLQPIKMNNTFFDVSKKSAALALPYSYINNSYKQLAMPQLKGIEPAGAIWSDIDDMARWLKFHLGTGKIDTTQLLSENAMAILKKPIYFTGQNMRADESEFKSYGLGMGFSAYKGHRVMYHTGVAGGYTSIFVLLPQDKIGIMILTNTDTYMFSMMDNLIDRALGLEQTDWNSSILAAYSEQKKEDEKDTKEQLLKIKNATPITDPNKYAGEYKHAFLRTAKIVAKANRLYLTYNAIDYPLAHVKDNAFMAYDEWVFGEMGVQFDTDKTGAVQSLQLKMMGQELQYAK